MPKGTMLDRLAGAMKTLGKREGKSLTPRQRVAAAQRWNSLADVGETIADRMWDIDRDEFYKVMDELERLGLDKLPKAPPEIAARYKDAPLEDYYDINRLDNPFLSDNIDKYAEQSDFLDWCRYNKVEPNARSLKQFRWETYKTLPYRERQWIANKDVVRNYMRDNYTLYGQQPPELKTLRDVDEYWTKNVWNGVEPREGYLEWAYPKRKPYESIEEFPDDFDYMWRY